jgi:hypothetical protein
MCKKLLTLSLNLFILMTISCTSEHKTKTNFHLESFIDNPRVFYGDKGDPCESSDISKNCERLSED